jgi:hypothetical protein
VNLPELHVGDELIMRRTQRGTHDSTVTVTKIGRRWAYADGGGWREIKFDKETGYEDGRREMSAHRVLTAEMDLAEKRLAAARDQLRALGVRLEPPLTHRISAETAEALAQVLATSKEATS